MDIKAKKEKQNLIERCVVRSLPIKSAINGIYIKEADGHRLAASVCIKPRFAKLMKRTACMLTVGMMIMLAIITSDYTLAMKVTLDGEVVGYAEDIAEASEQVHVAEEHISSVLGEQYELENVRYSRGFVRSEDMASGADLAEEIAYQSNIIEPLYVLSISGVEIGALENSGEYDKLVECITSFYDVGLGSTPTISTEMTVEKKEVSTELKMSAEELAMHLIIARDDNGQPLLTVTQENIETKTEVDKFEVVTVYDDTKYLDYSEKTQSGKDGLVERTTNTIYVNGVLSEVEVLKENVINKRYDEIHVQGTMEIPYWRATGEFETPVENIRKVTSEFGKRRWSQHTGIDLAGDTGEPILAADSGTVTFSGWGMGGYGRMVIIDHGNGYQTYYAHNSKLYVEEGDHVVKGDIIAALGSSGKSTGPHLHFEIIEDGVAVDPANFITFVAELG